MAFTFELDIKGYLKKRESFNLEYKQNFQLGDNLLKYIKTLVGGSVSTSVSEVCDFRDAVQS